ncbi:hypothetical protein [Bacillus mycoides]|uniref:hypothetical protein n=1 Tax=Bacillus mycoides TaxID=1405 RepID=UPI0011A1BFE7|nr:hypothetical protein [Bacillus mycoides]
MESVWFGLMFVFEGVFVFGVCVCLFWFVKCFEMDDVCGNKMRGVGSDLGFYVYRGVWVG